MNFTPRPSIQMNNAPRHVFNVAAMRENKNPHAVALGKMSSPEKAKAAQKNGAKGGRPEGS
jgi:hypothetical protein